MNGTEGTSTVNEERGRSWRSDLLKLLYPGLGIKRWLFVGAMGVAVWSIGVAFLLRKLFSFADPFPDFLPSYLEGVLLVAAAVALVGTAIFGLYRSIGPMVLSKQDMSSLADAVYTRRARGRGPRIVAIGGGTGLSVLLRGLKLHTDNLTAIVTVGDDGGSSGRLRRELGVLPPGDFRNCIVALSESEPLLADLFQYRFDQGGGLQGHSFGNLFIVAMANVTDSFEEALRESSKVLAVHGQVVPATVANVRLSARLKDGTTVHGESNIAEHGGGIDYLSIEPANAEVYGPAAEAILKADMVVIGPGSLYTSILPNLRVRGIVEALEESPAAKVYVCNIATQSGETDSYGVADHLEALQSHTFPSVVDYVIANDETPELAGLSENPVLPDDRPLAHATLVRAALTDRQHPLRHDPELLAKTLRDLYHNGAAGKSGGGSGNASGLRAR